MEVEMPESVKQTALFGAWNSKRLKSTLLAAAGSVALSASFAAYAQEEEPEDEVHTLQSITVTAQKREQSLQDVPISMAAFTGDALQDAGVADLGSLQGLVPNFQVSDNVSVRTIYVRGVGGGGRTVAFDTRTGIYLDGVYIGQPMSADAVLVNLERVEVLRGPQGYLYGQNTVSGAVNLVTAAPSEEFEAQVIGSYGNQDEMRLVGSINAPLIEDRLFMRFGASVHQRDGFIYNVTTGEYPDDQNDYAARLQLRYLFNPDFTADFSADFTRQLSHKVNGEARSDVFNTGGTPTPPADQPFVIDDDYPERDLSETWGLGLTLNYDFENVTLTSTTGYRHAYRNWNVDMDHSAGDWAFFHYHDEYNTFSQELRASGEVGNLNYVAGLYYMDTSGENDRTLVYSSLTALLGLPPNSVTNTNPLVDNTSMAVFTALDYGLTDTLTLNMGARLNYETKELTFNQSTDLVAPYSTLAVIDGYTTDMDETSFSPSIGLTWEPNDASTYYARYSRGVKSGGFNADYLNIYQVAADLSLDQETVDSYEIGAKFVSTDGQFSFNSALFYAKYEDYQVSQFRIRDDVVPSRIELALTNAGVVETYGPEFDLTWLPTNNLTLGLSGAWLHAEYSEFKDGGGIGVDYSGNRLEYAPEWTFAATLDYEHPFSNGSEGFVRLNASYHGDQYSDSSNQDQFFQEGYTLVNGRVGWVTPNGNTEFALYFNNLFDEEYDLGTAPDGFTTLFGKYGDPRTYGVEVSWTY
ncbi:MAG: hypothetical protein CBB65_03930 [Hyphomonadaceae bacterium TMED5]|nr:MAG: hypothetical protein CBB65_03930 [Hyphomonadaceae bacterium TMED5]